MTPWLALAKGLTYLGLALLLGGALMRRTRLAALPLGWLAAGAGMLLLGAALEVGSTLLGLGFTAPGDVEAYLSSTRSGRAALLRLMGAALLLAAEVQGQTRQAWCWPALLGAALTLWGVGSAGHAGERGLVWTLLDALHAGAAAIWVGGVLALLRCRPTAATTRRFSAVALSCAALLALSGAATVLLRIPLGLVWDALRGSSWGVTLLLKLGLIASALLSAVWVRRSLYARSGRAGNVHPLWLESALLMGVLGVSGALATTPPPTTAQLQQQTVAVSVQLAGQHLRGALILSGPGDVQLTLRPALPGLRARLIMTDHTMPAQTLSVQNNGDVLQAQTRLWMSGRWVLELSRDAQSAEVAFSN